jgi:rhodanese-related sulfurtransferase
VGSEIASFVNTIGHDDLAGRLAGGFDGWLAAGREAESIPLVDAGAIDGKLLDIRQDGEWVAGHVPGAIHVELGRLRELDPSSVPDGPVTVMCRHGERATTGASIQRAGGRAVSVLSGGPGDWSEATGVSLVSE